MYTIDWHFFERGSIKGKGVSMFSNQAGVASRLGEILGSLRKFSSAFNHHGFYGTKVSIHQNSKTLFSRIN